MKTTKTKVTQLGSGTWVAEILDDETGEVLVAGAGSTEQEARDAAKAQWKATLEMLAG